MVHAPEMSLKKAVSSFFLYLTRQDTVNARRTQHLEEVTQSSVRVREPAGASSKYSPRHLMLFKFVPTVYLFLSRLGGEEKQCAR